MIRQTSHNLRQPEKPPTLMELKLREAMQRAQAKRPPESGAT